MVFKEIRTVVLKWSEHEQVKSNTYFFNEYVKYLYGNSYGKEVWCIIKLAKLKHGVWSGRRLN